MSKVSFITYRITQHSKKCGHVHHVYTYSVRELTDVVNAKPNKIINDPNVYLIKIHSY